MEEEPASHSRPSANSQSSSSPLSPSFTKPRTDAPTRAPLSKCERDEDLDRWRRVSASAVGGGIVPMAQREDGSVVFLMAKEQLVPAWKGSYKWSAFEGGRKGHETIEETTMREWREESLECISLRCNEFSLQMGDYVCRLILNTEAVKTPRYHVTYLVCVPYEPQCVTRFSLQRRALLNLRCAAETLREATSACLVHARRPVLDFWYESTEGCVAFMNADRVIVRYEHPWPDSVSVWLKAQAALESAMYAVSNAACYKATRSINGKVMDVEVCADYLEKHCVKWWTLSDIRAVLRDGGKARDETFRTYFLPVMREIVGFLDGQSAGRERDDGGGGDESGTGRSTDPVVPRPSSYVRTAHAWATVAAAPSDGAPGHHVALQGAAQSQTAETSHHPPPARYANVLRDDGDDGQHRSHHEGDPQRPPLVGGDPEDGPRAHAREVSVQPHAVPDHVHHHGERGAADQEDDLVEQTRAEQGGDQGRAQRRDDADVARRVLDPGHARRAPQRDRRHHQARRRHQPLVPSDEEGERQHAARRRRDDARERGVRRSGRTASPLPEDVAQRDPLRERAVHTGHDEWVRASSTEVSPVFFPPSAFRTYDRGGDAAARGAMV